MKASSMSKTVQTNMPVDVTMELLANLQEKNSAVLNSFKEYCGMRWALQDM